MTIARRRASTFDTIAAPIPSPQPARAPVPGVGAPGPIGDAPAPEIITPVGRLRRCTFRRIDQVTALPHRPQLPTYEVMCLYGGGDDPMALGDIDAARSFCEACTADGIFRPDEA